MGHGRGVKVNRYKKLLSNTVVFAVGTFSSKVLVYLLVPLYTYCLTQQQFGVTDILQQTGNLLLPLVSMGMTNAVIRFGLDKSIRKTDVFTSGVIAVLFGTVMLIAVSPFLRLISFLQGYVLLLVVFSVTSTLRSLCSQFVRARGMVRLFALDGILSTLSTLLLTILFLAGLRAGITGYILAIVCADILSIVFLCLTARLPSYLKFKGLRRSVMRDMLRFSLPLIPNMVLWWITNVSDRYFIAYMLGEQANGIYAISYKIPSLIILVSGIFMNAWQISAITEQKDRDRFYSRVAGMFTALLFLLASGILLMARFIMKIWVNPSYFEAWRYVPLLTIATVFTCLVDFLGSVYLVEKRSMRSLVTAAVSAGVNVVLNPILIPRFGPNGAAFATFVCYFVVFVIRAIDTRRFIRIRWRLTAMLLSLAILFAQTVILLNQPPYAWLWEGLLVALMLVVHAKPLLQALYSLFFRGRRTGRSG